MKCWSMSQLGLGRVKTFGRAEFGSFSVKGPGFEAGYALIASISGRTPMMFITLVRL